MDVAQLRGTAHLQSIQPFELTENTNAYLIELTRLPCECIYIFCSTSFGWDLFYGQGRSQVLTLGGAAAST